MGKLSSSHKIYSIRCLAIGPIEVTNERSIFEDNQKISSSYDSYVKHPGEPLDEEPEEVRAIAEVFWTDERVALYEASRETANGVE